jgi:hypothetical protein
MLVPRFDNYAKRKWINAEVNRYRKGGGTFDGNFSHHVLVTGNEVMHTNITIEFISSPKKPFYTLASGATGGLVWSPPVDTGVVAQ